MSLFNRKKTKTDAVVQQIEKSFIEKNQELILREFKDWLDIRSSCATYIKKFVTWWVIFVVILLSINGYLSFKGFKFLSDAVVITLLSSTTIEILGLFAIVLWNVFPNKINREKPKREFDSNMHDAKNPDF